jgi:hypothetical protein
LIDGRVPQFMGNATDQRRRRPDHHGGRVAVAATWPVSRAARVSAALPTPATDQDQTSATADERSRGPK